MVPPASSYERQVYSPRVDLGGAAGAKAGVTPMPRRTVGGTAPTLEAPKVPSSKVKEQSIKIPDFFKK